MNDCRICLGIGCKYCEPREENDNEIEISSSADVLEFDSPDDSICPDSYLA